MSRIILMSKKHLTKKQQKTLCIAAVAAALILTALIAWRIGVPLVRFASEPEKFRDWVNSNGFGGRLAYVGMVIL